MSKTDIEIPIDEEMVASARILMVDDHAGNLLALEAILGPLGHPMVRASSADEAFRYLLDGDFAVILMDVQMPGTDGFAAASLIKQRERTRGIPIIFITALSRDASFVFRGYEHGAVDYILKPFEPVILRSKVAVFLELFLQRQQLKRQGQQLVEASQQRGERRYRHLSDSLPIAVWVTDRAGHIRYCNKRMLETCGVARAELEGSHWLESVHADDRERVRGVWNEAVATRTRAEAEFRIRQVGETASWQLGSIAPDEDGGEAELGFIVTATDISKQKAAQEEAERASRLKEEFLATVSHELRTPLNAILGWSQTLLEGTADASRTKHALQAIERNARAQAELIADILDVSRIVTGKLTLTLEELSMGPLVQSALEVVRPAADAKEIAISIDVELGDDRVQGDAGRIKQILWNLLSNAVKFTPRGGTVKVHLRRDGSDLEVSVEDSGPGIAPAFLPFVFDRFRQADSSSTRRHGGLGLGLAIAKHLVELQGGGVQAHSDGEGKGSRFTVRMPLRAVRTVVPAAISVSSDVHAATARATGTAPFLAGRKVLVVDDDADARELIELVFTRKGAEVVSAQSVEQAFSRMMSFTPDLIVSDIGMPDEDGYSLIRRLRACGPEQGGRTPAVALTGFAREDDSKKILEAGFQAHISKPVGSAKLLAVVEQLLAANDRSLAAK